MEVAHVDLCRGDAGLVLLYAVTASYGNLGRRIQKEFSAFPAKQSKAQEHFYNSILDALLDLHTSKC